jgi:hypothetical protein
MYALSLSSNCRARAADLKLSSTLKRCLKIEKIVVKMIDELNSFNIVQELRVCFACLCSVPQWDNQRFFQVN